MECQWLPCSQALTPPVLAADVLAEGSQELTDGALGCWRHSLLASRWVPNLCWPCNAPRSCRTVCDGLSQCLPGSQRGEREGNGKREWEQLNVERMMGYNQILLARHGLSAPAFTWKG